MVDIEKDLPSMMQSESKALRVSGSRQWKWLLQIQSWIIEKSSWILERRGEGASHHWVAEEGGKWENEQRTPEQQFLDLVMHQILVVYSDGYERKTKHMCMKLWPLLSKVTLSLHSAAMFQHARKICPTFLCTCFPTERSYLYNCAFFKDIRPSHLFPCVHKSQIHCYKYIVQKWKTYFMLL